MVFTAIRLLLRRECLQSTHKHKIKCFKIIQLSYITGEVCVHDCVCVGVCLRVYVQQMFCAACLTASSILQLILSLGRLTDWQVCVFVCVCVFLCVNSWGLASPQPNQCPLKGLRNLRQRREPLGKKEHLAFFPLSNLSFITHRICRFPSKNLREMFC